MCNSTSRLQVLLSEYEQVRDDERTYATIQVALVTTGVAVLTVLIAFTQEVIDRANKGHEQFPSIIIAVAPMAAVIVISFAEWIGTRSSVRGFYMRAIEREIRYELSKLNDEEAGKCEFHSYKGLKIASLGEFLVEHDSMAKGANTKGNNLMVIVAGCLALMFGGITFTLGLYVDAAWRVTMLMLYGAFTYWAFKSYITANINGRRYFHDCVDRYLDRFNHTLEDNRSKDQSSAAYLSYILLPHPDDLVKSIFTLLGLILGIILLPEDGRTPSQSIAFSSLVFFVIEFLAYQARYIINDCIGEQEDRLAPTRELRGRLPEGKRSSASKWAVLRIAIALWITAVVYLQEDYSDEGWRLFLSLFAILAISVLYEMFRNWERTLEKSNAGLVIAILFCVTAAYPLRFAIGIYVMRGITAFPALPWLLIVVACMSLGLVFVVPTWVLEAFSYAVRRDIVDSSFYVTMDILPKYHRLILARWAGYNLELNYEGNLRSDFDGANFRALKELGYRWYAPWRIGALVYNLALVGLFLILILERSAAIELSIIGLIFLCHMVFLWLFRSSIVSGMIVIGIINGIEILIAFHDFHNIHQQWKGWYAIACLVLYLPFILELAAISSSYNDTRKVAERVFRFSSVCLRSSIIGIWTLRSPKKIMSENRRE